MDQERVEANLRPDAGCCFSTVEFMVEFNNGILVTTSREYYTNIEGQPMNRCSVTYIKRRNIAHCSANTHDSHIPRFPPVSNTFHGWVLVSERDVYGLGAWTADGHNDPSRIHKVRAHAERRKARSDWTPKEVGNSIADATAAGDSIRAGGPITEWTAERLQRYLKQDQYCIWTTGYDVTFGTRQRKEQQMLRTYLRNRDAIRSRTIPPRAQRWSSTTTALAHTVWNRTITQLHEGLRPMGAVARAVRIAYDKHMTGENTIKWGIPNDTPHCKFCGGVTS